MGNQTARDFFWFYFSSIFPAPPQVVRFSQSRGATGDEPQETMGRVQTAGEATSRPLSPSHFPLRAHFHRERDIWVRGSYFPMKVAGRNPRSHPPFNDSPVAIYLPSTPLIFLKSTTGAFILSSFLLFDFVITGILSACFSFFCSGCLFLCLLLPCCS